MTLIEYLNTKYPSGNFGLMSAEAKVFRIKYPLQAGWLQKHQNDAITPLQIRELKALLQKKDKEINKRTLEFLEREFKDNHIELVKSAVKASFPSVGRIIPRSFLLLEEVYLLDSERPLQKEPQSAILSLESLLKALERHGYDPVLKHETSGQIRRLGESHHEYQVGSELPKEKETLCTLREVK